MDLNQWLINNDVEDMANALFPNEDVPPNNEQDFFVMEDLDPLFVDIDLPAYNRERKQRAIALWNINRTQARQLLRRHEHPASRVRREQERAQGLPLTPRVMMQEIVLAPEEIPPDERMPMYQNSFQEGLPPPVLQPRDAPETDIVTVDHRDIISDIVEYHPNVIPNEHVPQRLLSRLFQNRNQRYLFRRFIFGANIPEELYQNNWEFAANLSSVVFILLLYCIFQLLRTPGRMANNLADFTRPNFLNLTIPAEVRNRRIWWSITIYNDDQNRYSGFELGIEYRDVLRRVGQLLYQLAGDVKIELTLIYEIPQGDNMNPNALVSPMIDELDVTPFNEPRLPEEINNVPYNQVNVNMGNWTIRPRRVRAPRPTEAQRLGGAQNILNYPRRGPRVAGYNVQEFVDQPFLCLAQERNWEIQQPISSLQLSPAILRRVKNFRRKSVEQVNLPDQLLALSNGNIQVGSYELLEPHTVMFYKESVMRLYAKNGSVFYTPETPSYSCFLMAFLRAQCIEYEFNGSKEFVSEAEVPGPRIPCTLPQWSTLQQNYSFVQYDVEKEDFYLHLFETDITNQEMNCNYSKEMTDFWELGARELEQYIRRRKGEYVDVNDLETVGTLVSELFQVVVQVFDIQTSDKRAWIFAPAMDRYIGQQVAASQGKLRMISLLYDQGHMIPIRDLRCFLTVKNKHKLRNNAYCPFCEKHGGTQMHSKKGCFQHLTACFKKHYNDYWNSLSLDPVNLEGNNAVIPIKNQFNVEMKQLVPTCIYCSEHVPQAQFIHHRCHISPRPPPKEPKNPSSFYVYDIEAAQVFNGERGVTYHVCNMLVFRKMYPETAEERNGKMFENEYDFMDHLMNGPEYENAVIIAHNGGAYDHHFIVRYLERMKIAHQFVPTPNSLHKFLSVSITEKEITFLDFIHFMPGSLKSISESMGLSVTKGDFPHRFNTSPDTSYRGRIPPMGTEEDYWCMSTKKSEKDIMEMQDFYEEQADIYCVCEEEVQYGNHETHCATCEKKLWIMKDQMYHYCKLDVDVLGEACARYRDQLLALADESAPLGLDIPWNPSNIEPYDFMTVPQLAMQILLQGYVAPIFRNSMDKKRIGQTQQGLIWMESIQREQNKRILHRQNHHKEYFCYDLQLFVDGYCPETDEMFVCLDCDLYACPDCHFHNIQTLQPHPHYPYKSFLDVSLKTAELIDIWKFRGAHVIFACKVDTNVSPYHLKCLDSKPMASFFYGGRTEVFQPYKKCLPGETIQYHDVCSLYPYVCAFEELPFDVPEYIPGFEIQSERLFHPDPQQKYWGYIRAKVRPNPECVLGLLPCRNEDGRLVFSLEVQEGCWGLNEVELAVSQGYILEEIYEIIHWGPDKRSNQLFRGYVDYFLKMKQQAEGWVKLGGHSNMTEEEKDALIDRLFASNGQIGHIDKNKVEKNPIRRALAKLFLNSLWGKFAQKPRSKRQGIIYSANDFIQIWSNDHIKKKSILFRETGVGIFKYQYELKSAYTPENAKGNLFLAAKVTEHARCILHRQMIKIHPERILYCDTDSVLFVWPENGPDLTGIGLGKWTNEYPTKRIVEFLALAPKFYMLVFPEDTCLKVKGIQLTQKNIKTLHAQCLKELLWGEFIATNAGEKRKSDVYVDHMTIFSNCHANRGVEYGVMMTRYAKKIVQFVITKRVLLKYAVASLDDLENIKTLPYGHRLLRK